MGSSCVRGLHLLEQIYYCRLTFLFLFMSPSGQCWRRMQHEYKGGGVCLLGFCEVEQGVLVSIVAFIKKITTGGMCFASYDHTVCFSVSFETSVEVLRAWLSPQSGYRYRLLPAGGIPSHPLRDIAPIRSIGCWKPPCHRAVTLVIITL